jgi:hypothetical protein
MTRVLLHRAPANVTTRAELGAGLLVPVPAARRAVAWAVAG